MCTTAAHCQQRQVPSGSAAIEPVAMSYGLVTGLRTISNPVYCNLRFVLRCWEYSSAKKPFTICSVTLPNTTTIRPRALIPMSLRRLTNEGTMIVFVVLYAACVYCFQASHENTVGALRTQMTTWCDSGINFPSMAAMLWESHRMVVQSTAALSSLYMRNGSSRTDERWPTAYPSCLSCLCPSMIAPLTVRIGAGAMVPRANAEHEPSYTDPRPCCTRAKIHGVMEQFRSY
jgi:hypothetical protein